MAQEHLGRVGGWQAQLGESTLEVGGVTMFDEGFFSGISGSCSPRMVNIVLNIVLNIYSLTLLKSMLNNLHRHTEVWIARH